MKQFTFTTCIYVLFLIPFASLPGCAQSWNDWHYHVDATMTPQQDDTFDAVYADFTHLLESTFEASGTLDENSIRVVPLQNGQAGAPVDYRFVKAADYDAAKNAAGTLIFPVAGSKVNAAQYRVYFDTRENGTKPTLAQKVAIPETVNMVWNGDLEILSAGYNGPNRYANAGENMPRGWWGNLRNVTNFATSAHSGNHALGLRTPEDKNNNFISSSPSQPGLRVQPGQTYSFSLWVKGEDLSGKWLTVISARWLDAKNKLLKRETIDAGISKKASYDWTQAQSLLTAPNNAESVIISVGTYSKTGVLTIDDFDVHLAVPPLLGGE